MLELFLLELFLPHVLIRTVVPPLARNKGHTLGLRQDSDNNV